MSLLFFFLFVKSCVKSCVKRQNPHSEKAKKRCHYGVFPFYRSFTT